MNELPTSHGLRCCKCSCTFSVSKINPGAVFSKQLKDYGSNKDIFENLICLLHTFMLQSVKKKIKQILRFITNYHALKVWKKSLAYILRLSFGTITQPKFPICPKRGLLRKFQWLIFINHCALSCRKIWKISDPEI